MREFSENELVRQLEPIRTVRGYHGALILTDGLLLTNQLPYSDERAVELLTPILEMHASMVGAGREVRHLIFQSRSCYFVFVPFGEHSLVVRVSPMVNVDLITTRAAGIIEGIRDHMENFALELLYEDDAPQEKEIVLPILEGPMPTVGTPMAPPPEIARRILAS